MIEGTWKAFVAEWTHWPEYSTAHALLSQVKRKASSQEMISRGLKEESNFKTEILSILLH